MRNLLLQLEDFLRESVDLRVLFVDFFRQRFKLRHVDRFGGLRRRSLGCTCRKQGEPGKERRKETSSELHHQILASAAAPGKPLRIKRQHCWQLAFPIFTLKFFYA